MTIAAGNIHATAIVVGTAGLLFTGPSGSGKSSTAFACLSSAREAGLFAALVADDQVLVENAHGRLLARCPHAIEGLIEIRGTGIVHVPWISAACMTRIIRLSLASEAERLPQAEESSIIAGVCLPAVDLAATRCAPLAVLAASGCL